MERVIKIELFGQSYKFAAETDGDVEDCQMIADYVADKVSEVEKQLGDESRNMSKQTILILALLNIANKKFNLQSCEVELRKSISERSFKLISLLDGKIDL